MQVALVLSILVRKGRLTVGAIHKLIVEKPMYGMLQVMQLTMQEIKDALVVLIQHNLVTYISVLIHE